MKEETGTLDIDKVSLLRDHILLLKCFNENILDDDGKVLVYLTDQTQDTTRWCEVIKIGPGCKTLTPDILETKRLFMHIPEYEQKGWHKVGDFMFVIREKLIDQKGSEFKPFVIEEEK